MSMQMQNLIKFRMQNYKCRMGRVRGEGQEKGGKVSMVQEEKKNQERGIVFDTGEIRTRYYILP